VDATIKRDPYCRCSVVGLFHSTEGAGSYQPRPTAWVLSAKRTQGLKARFIRVVSRKWFERPPLKDPGMRASAHLGHT
jgi:hypothetical protein